MNWFILALFSSALWSISNHIDKHLISKYFKNGSVGALIIFSALIGLFVFPIILYFQPNVLEISWLQVLAIILNSVILIFATILYLYALQKEEASVVMPFIQTAPIFAYILGYFVLHESLSSYQIIGSLLIVLASIGLSFEIEDGKRLKLKTSLLLLMFTVSFLIALGGLIFKFMAIETDFWTTAFWGYVGDTLIALFFVFFVRSYRKEFFRVFKRNSLPVLGLNMFNETITVIANLIFRFATLLAPLALVWTANGFQPFFVFLFGILITLFFPRIGTESLMRRDLLQKGVAIFVMFVGAYIMNI